MGIKSTPLMETVNAMTRTEPFSREIGNLLKTFGTFAYLSKAFVAMVFKDL